MSHDNEKFAQDMRKSNRKEKNYLTPEETQDIKNSSLKIIKSSWHEHITSDPLPKDTYKAVYKLIDVELRQHLKTQNRFMLGRLQLLIFIREQNLYRQRLNLPNYPEPSLLKRVFRAQPVKDIKWSLNGRKLADLTDQALQLWSKKNTYTHDEILGWALFSAIFWGGLNDQAALDDFLIALENKRQLFFIPDQNLHFIQLDAVDNSFGYYDEHQQLKRSYSFVLDDITRSWLIRLSNTQNSNKSVDVEPSVESLLNNVLAQLQTDIRYASKHSARILKYASYCWEQIPDVQIDQLMVRVLVNQQPSCSLAAHEMMYFLQPDIQRKPLHLDMRSLLKGNIPKIQSTILKKSESEVFAQNAIVEIRKIFKDLKRKKISDPIPPLQQLAVQQEYEGHARLIAWTIDLFKSERSRKKLRGSSVVRYLYAVAKDWLILTFWQNISKFKDFEFEKIYKDMIELRENNKSFYGKLILRFHQFQIRNYNAPDIDFDVEYGGTTCRAHIIPFLVYYEMCLALDEADGINQADRKLLKLLLIVTYRTGLRREEIVGLQFRDIEWEKLSFIIRANSAGGTKSDSAYRRIPLWAFLKSDELKLLTDYLQEKKPKSKSNMGRAIFSLASSHHRLPSELPYYLLTTLMKSVLSEHRYNFHSLRHSALSNLSLILHGSSELITFFTDYSPEDCDKIRNALLGHQHKGQDRWHGLAQFAGHLSPYTTFASYIHFAHLIGGHAISQGNVVIPLAAFLNITGYEKRRIDRNVKDAINESKTHVELPKLRSILSRDLSHLELCINVVYGTKIKQRFLVPVSHL